jgi:ABC-2 type transport system ATP-binding protein
MMAIFALPRPIKTDIHSAQKGTLVTLEFFMSATQLSPDFMNRPDSGLAIEVSSLSKTYGGSRGKPAHQALDAVDLQVPAGSIFGLLGPNGAGKSTLINILAGTVVKTSGTAIVWGTNIERNPRQARANIGIVPQELNVDAFFTPRQTIDLMAGLYGVPKTERQTDAILDMVGLTEQADMYARQLSGGMRRRLLVGKAMVHQPPILILDEPTAGVDVALRQRLWNNIKTLNAAGVTVVLTTHYLEEAEALCDHIAIVNNGRIVTAKSTADLMSTAGKKQLHVMIAGPPPSSLPKPLQKLGAIWQDGRLSISFDPTKTTALALLAEVEKANFDVRDISTVEPDLEEVFISLTRKPIDL